jgi:hypothetical protein
MDGNQLKKRIYRWAKEVGIRRARIELVGAGVGFSTAEKLIAGTYGSTPKTRVAEALESLLARKASEKAS